MFNIGNKVKVVDSGYFGTILNLDLTNTGVFTVTELPRNGFTAVIDNSNGKLEKHTSDFDNGKFHFCVLMDQLELVTN